MALQDDIYVIDDENVLQVEERRRRPVRAVPPPRRQGAAEPIFDLPASGVRAGHGSSRPLVAASLSLFLCGAGQAFNGQRQLGLLFFLVEALVVAIHWSAASMWGFLLEMGGLFEVSEEAMLMSLAGVDLLFVLFVLGNIAQAYRRASSGVDRFEGLGRPAFSALASLLVPGWGQLFNAQLGKALVFLFCLLGGLFATATLFLSPFVQYFERANLIGLITQETAQAAAGVVLMAGVIWVLSVYDALLVARYRDRIV